MFGDLAYRYMFRHQGNPKITRTKHHYHIFYVKKTFEEGGMAGEIKIG